MVVAPFTLFCTKSASAEVIIHIYENGGNVITTGSGTLDTTDLTDGIGGSQPPRVGGSPPFTTVTLGKPSDHNFDGYSGLTGPTSFGSGFAYYASFGSGDLFGVSYYNSSSMFLVTPHGYASGASLSATDTYTSKTLAGLGLTSGVYTFTWGTGSHADSLVVNIAAAPASVPELSTFALLGIGGIGLAVGAYRRRRAAVPAVTGSRTSREPACGL